MKIITSLGYCEAWKELKLRADRCPLSPSVVCVLNHVTFWSSGAVFGLVLLVCLFGIFYLLHFRTHGHVPLHLCLRNAHACTHVEARGQHWASLSITLHLIFWGRVSRWPWSSLPWVCLLPTTEITGASHSTWFLHAGSWRPDSGPYTCMWALYQRSPLPRPLWCLFLLPGSRKQRHQWTWILRTVYRTGVT